MISFETLYNSQVTTNPDYYDAETRKKLKHNLSDCELKLKKKLKPGNWGILHTIAARDIIGIQSSLFGEVHDLPVFETSENAKRVERNHDTIISRFLNIRYFYCEAQHKMEWLLRSYEYDLGKLSDPKLSQTERKIQYFERVKEVFGISHNLKPQPLHHHSRRNGKLIHEDKSTAQKHKSYEDEHSTSLSKKTSEEVKPEQSHVNGPFTEFEERKIRDNFGQLRKILDDPAISESVKYHLLTANVSAVIAGEKPVSEFKIEFETERWKTWNKPCIPSETQQLINCLNEMGISYCFVKNEDKGSGAQWVYVWKDVHHITEEMQRSELFTEQEIEMAQDDIGKFISGVLCDHRIGILFGYPHNDVKHFIKRDRIIEEYARIKNITRYSANDLIREGKVDFEVLDHEQAEILKKNSKGVYINGVTEKIAFCSISYDNPEVKTKIDRYNRVFEIEKAVLGKK